MPDRVDDDPQLVSLVCVAIAPSFAVLMTARAFLGIAIGGFWSLSTATVMRLVPEGSVAKAMGAVYMGNAVATALAAPVGSYLGGLIGWRGVFWVLVPFAVATLAWQWMSLPSMPPRAAVPLTKVLGLLKRRKVAVAMLGVMLSFGGAFATFTYLRPFLETVTHATPGQLSLLLLGLDAAGFLGTLMVAAIQLAIMLGAAFGGWRLDHFSIAATFVGGTVLLVAASLAVGSGHRLRAQAM